MYLSSKYYFRNTYADYEFGFTFGTHNAQIKTKILSLLEQILNQKDLEEDHDCDGGIYSGLGGIAYMFLHLLRPSDEVLTTPERVKIAPVIQKFLNLQLLYYSKTRAATIDENESQKVGFLVGDAGVFAVGAVLAKAIGNEELQFQCLTEYIAAAKVAKRKEFHKKGSDELFYGRTGYLCGALWLNQYLGHQPVPQNDLYAIWKLIVESGRENAKKIKNCRYPLAYTFSNKQYIGAAHGLSSILQILLSWPQFLANDPTAETDIRRTLDYFVRVVFQDYGNFFTPCTMDEVKSNLNMKHPTSGTSSNKITEENYEVVHKNGLAQWCYGAPGFVYLLAKAGLHYKSHEYLKCCLKCADLIWTYGLIKKGPGLCHGIAGNGYVFLLLYRLTENDPKYLYRALRFAEFLFSAQFREESEIPEHPFSLFEGLAGTICFLSDVIRPSTAEFPFFNVFYEPGLSTVQPMPLAIPNIASELIAQLQSATAGGGGPTISIKDLKQVSSPSSSSNEFQEEDTIEYGTEISASHLLQMEMRVKEEPIEIEEQQSCWRYSLPEEGPGAEEY